MLNILRAISLCLTLAHVFLVQGQTPSNQNPQQLTQRIFATEVGFDLYTAVSLKLPVRPDRERSIDLPECLDSQKESFGTPVYREIRKGDLTVVVLALLTEAQVKLCSDLTGTGLSSMTSNVTDGEAKVKVYWNPESRLRRVEVERTLTTNNRTWVNRFVVQTRGKMMWMLGIAYPKDDASASTMAQAIYDSRSFIDRKP